LTLTGWLLDIHEHAAEGVVIWLIGTDGERYRLRAQLPVTVYVAGSFQHLRQLWKYLSFQELDITLARVTRPDLFAGNLEVLAATLQNPVGARTAFFKWQHDFKHLTWYDADIPVPLRFAALHQVFPLAKVELVVDPNDWIKSITPLDSPWDLEPETPNMRTLKIHPDVDPARAVPQVITCQTPNKTIQLKLDPLRQFLVNFMAVLRREDPDILLTQYGDTWLFPLAREYCEEYEIDFFNPSRDPDLDMLQREARSYFTYGQTLYRGQQTYLFGRWHIDECNAMMYGDYGLAGVLEQARVTGLPVQEVARKSPGAGITALQIVKALQLNILIPYQKQQAETFKSARQLIAADRGGLVGPPIVGLHENVAEIDFVSMYPSIMVEYNISPETVGAHSQNATTIPELDIPIDLTREGFIPITLRPLVQKRVRLKQRMQGLDRRDYRYGLFKTRAQGLKWLLVVCFGYLGYKNARFGRIESHMAVTAYGRECLLRAKEAAEDLGYRVLYLYMDGLWVQKEGINPVNLQPLLDEILRRTKLPIALEGIYRWIAFLPSRVDARVPVANRYFGVFDDGRIKVRGLEVRRRDTPPWIFKIQTNILENLARMPDTSWFPALLPGLIRSLDARLAELSAFQVPVEDLVMTQTLSRELESYRVPSPAARAAIQLQRAGKNMRPGQRIRFVYTRNAVGVLAWDQHENLSPQMIDTARYRTLLMRAVHNVLQPFGVSEMVLENWLNSKAGYGAPVGVLPPGNQAIPLFAEI